MSSIIWSTDKLHTWDKNPRSIHKDDFARLKRLITKLGVFKPFVITKDGTVLGGNMRLKACIEMGIKEVPVVIVDAPDEKTKVEYALADNDRVGYYDDQALAELVQSVDIDLGDFKVDIGQPISIAKLLEQFGPDIAEDEAPDISNAPAISQLGEVYQLGRHRLMCGDATKIEDVEKLMDGQKADMVFTDPPYGIDVVSSTVGGSKPFGSDGAKNIVEANQYSPIIGDDTTQTAQDAYNLVKSQDINTIAFWGGNYFTDFLPPSKGWLIWDKKGKEWEDNFSDCEMLWTNKNIPTKIIRHQFMGLVQEGEREARVHPTQKPVAMTAKCFQYLEGEKVLDLFGGSGSTLIACEQLDRICYMMELDPKYCDVIRKRYNNFIGKGELWRETTPKI